MLVVVRPAAGRRVQQIFSDYELHADLVGTITEDGRMRIRDGARQLADIPLSSLLDGVPLRPVPSPGPAMEQPADRLPQARKAPPLDDPQSWLLRLLASPNLCSRRPIFRTYDHQVLNNTVIPPGQDAALLRIPGTRRGLALSTDGNPRYVALDPYLGTVGAVAEAARNIACTGARPLAVTNCLNFGNPERAFVHRQLQESVRGLGDACRAFGLPVVSGNVSLFNETSGKNIIPSPVVGMVGLLEDLAHRRPSGFQEEGDLIFLLGSSQEELAGSEFERLWGAPLGTSPPLVDLDLERRLQRLLAESVAEALLRSAHDLAEGGLLVALAEACLFSGRGARCAALTGTASPAALYFGESQGRVLVTAAPRLAPDLHRQATSHGIPLAAIGVVGGDELIVGSDIRLRLDAMRDAWETPW
jgi:phosphoribosylformylglycinamidine synthase